MINTVSNEVRLKVEKGEKVGSYVPMSPMFKGEVRSVELKGSRFDDVYYWVELVDLSNKDKSNNTVRGVMRLDRKSPVRKPEDILHKQVEAFVSFKKGSRNAMIYIDGLKAKGEIV